MDSAQEHDCKKQAPAVLVFVLLLANSFIADTYAQRWFPPDPNDTCFVVDSGPDLDTPCTFRSGGPLIVDIPVTRYVGPTRLDKTLQNPELLIENNIVSEYAWVKMPVWDVDIGGNSPSHWYERDEVYFNDHYIGYCYGWNNTWYKNSFKVPIKYVKFPPVSSSAPAINTIRVEIDVLNKKICECWCTALDWVELSFQAARPVLLAHGFNSNYTIWEYDGPPPAFSWADALDDLPLPFWNPKLWPYGSYRQNSHIIDQEVFWMKHYYGVDMVNIVGHSKGGVDARYFIDWSNDVERLVMIAAPNAGTPLADMILGYIPILPGIPDFILEFLHVRGLRQLTTSYMRSFNRHVHENSNTEYMALAGNYDPDGWFEGGFWLWGEDDYIVQVSSVHALDYAKNGTFTSFDEDLSARHTYQIDNYDRAYNMTIGSIASLTSNPPEGETPQPLATSSSLPVQQQRTYSVAGHILPESTYVHYITVDSVGMVFPYCVWGQGNLNLVVTDPNGTRIDSTLASVTDSIVYESTDIFGAINMEYYGIMSDSLKGTWTFEVSAESIDASGATYVIGAVVSEESVTLGASSDKEFYRNSEPIVLTAIFEQDSNPILNASASAIVCLPDSSIETIELFDDGTHGDPLSDDGQYVNSFTNTSQAGFYIFLLRVDKSWPDPFSREYTVISTVSAGGSTVNGSILELAVDTDGDTLYNQLGFDVGITITDAREYELSGDLYDINDELIDASVIDTIIGTGSHNLHLSFDGHRIYENGVDGPYYLNNLSLAEVDTLDLIPVDFVDSAYVSNSYGYREFQRTAVYPTGVSTDHGIDINDNGLFDSLIVNIEVDLRYADYYEWSINLFDSLGTLLDYAHNAGALDSGLCNITISFDGSKIGANGVDAPYIVTDMLMFGIDSTSLVTSTLATPSGYRSTEFEGSSIPYWGGHINGNYVLNHEVILNEDLIIDSTGILTINPGVTIYVLPDSQISILNYGSIIANGISSGSIRFLSWVAQGDTAYPGDWDGISTVGGGNLQMDYCQLVYADYGIKADSASSFVVKRSAIADNMTSGIYLNTPPAATNISKTRIDRCGAYGIYSTAGAVVAEADTISDCLYGIKYVGNGELTVTNSAIMNSSMGSGGTYYGIYASNLTMSDLQVIVDNCRIRGFDQGGVYFQGVNSMGYIRDTFTDTTGQYGIYYADSYADIVGSPSFYSRTSGNTCGLYLTQNSAPKVRRTKFWNNGDYGAYIDEDCPADFGQIIIGDYGENSFQTVSSSISYKDIFNADSNYVDAYRNYWGEPTPNILEIVRADYYPFLDKDPLPKIAEYDDEINTPEDLELAGSYPNPFNSSTLIRYNLESSKSISLKIFNITGQEVTALFDGHQTAGMHTVVWDGKNSAGNPVSAGVYFCRLQTSQNQRTIKMTVLK